MKYSIKSLLPGNIASDEDVDLLFDQLEVIEPPPFLVENILASVKRLSAGIAVPSQSRAIDGFITRGDAYEPS
jgi:hypothetical protein